MAKIYGEIGASALMTFDKSFARSNGQPLDSTEVFYSKSAAETYAAGEVAYVGQKIVVVETVEEVTKVTHYGIEPDGSLKELGASVVGDEKSIVVAEDGTISLAGIEGLVFTETVEGGEVAITYQPLMTKDGLTWVRPSATTVEGLATEIEGLKARLSAVEAKAHEHANADVLDGVTAEKVEAWDAAEGNAKQHATDLNTAMDARVAAIEGDHLVNADKEALQSAINAKADQADLDGVANRVTAVEASVADLVADHLDSDDKAELVEAIATAKQEAIEAVLGENVNADFDTLQEVAAWIQSDTTNSAQLISRVSAIEDDYLKGVDKEELIGEIDALSQFVGDIPEGSASANVVAYIWEVVDSLKIGDYAKASELTALANRVTALETAVATLEAANSERNVIASVDENNFEVDADRKLTLKDIDISKVTGLQDALDGKAAKGTTLAEYGIGDAYTKTETLDKIAEKITEINGGESAGEVLGQLNSYKETNDARMDAAEGKLANIEDGAQVNAIDGVSEEFAISDDEKVLSVLAISKDKITGLSDALAAKVDAVEGKSLVDDTLIARLEGVADGANANLIEKIMLGDVEAEIADKTVVVPGASNTILGMVMGSEVENGVVVNEDHTMTVHSLNVNKLVQTDGEFIVMYGGNSSLKTSV